MPVARQGPNPAPCRFKRAGIALVWKSIVAESLGSRLRGPDAQILILLPYYSVFSFVNWREGLWQDPMGWAVVQWGPGVG